MLPTIQGVSRKAIAFLIVCVLLIGNLPVSAQPSAPLILNVRGDLWAWGGPGQALQRRTNWGYNKEPIISPLGNQFAYKSTATVAVEVIKRSGGLGGGDLPANIWVMDIASTNATRIADQPPDASLMTPNKPDKYIVRSRPAWSPDGKSLAWTELIQENNQPEGRMRLVTYSFEKKAAYVIVPELPPQYGVPVALDVAWGASGITLASASGGLDANGFASPDVSILVFRTNGKQLSSAKIGLLAEFAWITDAGKEYVAVLSNGTTDKPNDPQWLMVEPQTGKIVTMPGVPEMYSLTNPNGVSVFPASLGTSPEWQIAAPGKPIAKLGNIDDVYVFPTVLSIAPDGKQVAYVKQGQAYVYADGQIIKVGTGDVSALTWGPTAWRVRRQKAG
ncbi:MAG: PD40 domain-containing protein [Anaerolineae bacterium]|nr:PD40 domain-containing protein [Anaerolineae bacterium]